MKPTGETGPQFRSSSESFSPDEDVNSGGLTWLGSLKRVVRRFDKTLHGSLWVFFFIASVLNVSCTSDPEAVEQETPQAEKAFAEAEPSYLYQPPPERDPMFATARLKGEDLAEAFVSRFKAISSGSVLVMQQEKMVLEVLGTADTSRFLCVDPLFPGYVGTLLGRLYQHNTGLPSAISPLYEFYPAGPAAAILAGRGYSYGTSSPQGSEQYRKLMASVEARTGTTYGMAAEDLVFEPLEIDEYQLKAGELCVPPHALLQLSSIWMRKGRWGNQQFLSENFVKTIVGPAYTSEHGSQANGWQYFRLRAKGRKQPVLFWKNTNTYLFLLPELESVILIRAEEPIQAELWDMLQQYLIPALFP